MKSSTDKTNEDRKLWNFFQSNEIEHTFSQAGFRLNLVASRVKSLIPSGSVMDIGLGDGYLMNALHKHRFTVTGLDISDVNVEKLKQRSPADMHFIVGDITKMPIADNTFDGITASEILEHMSTEELHAAIPEIRRVLKTGGYAVITVPGEEDLNELVCYCPHCGNTFHRYGHQQTFTREKLETLFSQFGYSSVKVEKFIELPLHARTWLTLKNSIKNKLVNLPFAYFRSYRGRYMITLQK